MEYLTDVSCGGGIIMRGVAGGEKIIASHNRRKGSNGFGGKHWLFDNEREGSSAINRLGSRTSCWHDVKEPSG